MTFLVEHGLRCGQGLCERGSLQEKALEAHPSCPASAWAARLLWAPALGSLT